MGRLKFKRALVALRMFGVHASNVSPVGHCCMDIVVAVRFNMMRIQSACRMIERDTDWKPCGQIPTFLFAIAISDQSPSKEMQ